MNETIAVVGAGIAGLLLARELKARGAEVVVFEKSRGLGGRMATKRVGEAVFDTGAQYFTAKSERFAAQVTELAAAGGRAVAGGFGAPVDGKTEHECSREIFGRRFGDPT